jgi:hypothetical protein
MRLLNVIYRVIWKVQSYVSWIQFQFLFQHQRRLKGVRVISLACSYDEVLMHYLLKDAISA